ncbi:hypothetical protein GGD56_002745 [Rhizobium mongolense]|uniref:Uncharacterized protein n=1 Tax=Rhizobium mongolense TaxID=57676 RepID=A0ABR6IMU2_9HYPH|nr:hypothetical protein [Rhizobium mongolense]
MAHVEVGEQAGKAPRSDCAHDADLEVRVVEAEKFRCLGFDAQEFVLHLLETRTQEIAEIGDVGKVPFATEKQPAHFVLELLNRSAQRGLGDIAVLRRAREIARFANGQKIPDVMDIHIRSANNSKVRQCIYFGPARYIPPMPLNYQFH